MSKPVYKSKEVWLALFGLYNIAASQIGIPHIEPTDAFIAAIIGAIGAIRILYTESKLTIK